VEIDDGGRTSGQPPGHGSAVGLRIGRLPARSADDGETLLLLVDLINRVYSKAEEGLWSRGTTRTTAAEVAQFVRKREIVVALAGTSVAGCVRLYEVDDAISGFGMLAVPSSHRSTGVGRELVQYAERVSAAEGRTTMQLEVLVPRGWSHPSKDFLVDWYSRIGYRIHAVERLEDAFPDLAPSLATDCDFVVFRKSLTRQSADDERGQSAPPLV
jgi:GNAT superfamily N-acetyltransferase